MLLGIPRVLDGELLKVLCDMGHGDEIVIADANFPAERCGQRVLKTLSSSGVEIIDAILCVMPLDHLGNQPACLMEIADGDNCLEPVIWEEYDKRIAVGKTFDKTFKMLNRDAFYERASSAFAVVQTGETALYGNVILRKGVVKSEVTS